MTRFVSNSDNLDARLLVLLQNVVLSHVAEKGSE